MKKRIIALTIFFVFSFSFMVIADGIGLYLAGNKSSLWFNNTNYYMKASSKYSYPSIGVIFEASLSRAITFESGAIYNEISSENTIPTTQNDVSYELKLDTKLKTIRIPFIFRIYLLNEEISPSFITGFSLYGVLGKEDKALYPEGYIKESAIIFPIWKTKDFFGAIHFGLGIQFLPETLKLEIGLLYSKSITKIYDIIAGAEETKLSSLEIFIKKTF